ncbi:methyltransferase [Schaalia sp. 19OD2882]|uniref:class I SAM-dependent methyltransferase n=1 Tax=Schaalia sp. 19OD2882 TaxID=2794089 RepID=UPI001C1F0614|nr:methyltransferase [Schaalia sp. 19OD2882]QWW18956.1 methyltransferase [Schaalia sp. 19OD2882]
MEQQYFTDQPAATEAELRRLHVSVRGFEVEMWVSDKVFSGSRLDLGTRQLLAEAPALPGSGTFLDLGCGWGPVAVAMALESPGATVWAVDVNTRALELTRRNAVHNETSNVVPMAADQALTRARAEGVRFDAIWSNPPVRIGKEAMHVMLTSWLDLLSDQGVAHLVVQRNMGADSLTAWLCERGYRAGKIASKKGYRIIEVHPRSS